MTDMLPSSLFIRIHKSYLISLSALTGVKANKAMLEGATLPISRLYRSKVLKQLRN
jgi:DNA-binding LytR/AlgR family response regulator